ncbi:MAG: hypothetical protein MUC48_07495 [Leptolyngbya sp. Prado105]|nr:hypothetical protein [Leptolyngbya sp. Prado105]
MTSSKLHNYYANLNPPASKSLQPGDFAIDLTKRCPLHFDEHEEKSGDRGSILPICSGFPVFFANFFNDGWILGYKIRQCFLSESPWQCLRFLKPYRVGFIFQL